MELVDITDLAKESEFRVFRSVADSGGRVRGINAKGAAEKYSRKRIDELTEFIKQDFGAGAWCGSRSRPSGTLASPTAKQFAPELLAKIGQRMDAQPGDLLLFVADKFEATCKALYGLRKRLGAELKLYDAEGDALLLGRRVPDVRLGRGGKVLGRHAPSLHGPAAAGLRTARDRPRQVPGAGLRPGDQRLRGRRRHDPDPRPGGAVSRSSTCWASTASTPGSGSASCWTRCNSAPRRTAASPWASTAG